VSAGRGLTAAGLAFLTERHLATLTTMRADGSPHVVPVGFTWDDATGLARVITSGPSRKVVNAEARPWAALCQLDGRRWLTLEGPVTVRRDPAAVADAESRYAQRYRVPRINPRRVCLEIAVQRLLGSPELLDRSPT
jgi:F420H(2)-dependent biliverdin reductase